MSSKKEFTKLSLKFQRHKQMTNGENGFPKIDVDAVETKPDKKDVCPKTSIDNFIQQLEVDLTSRMNSALNLTDSTRKLLTHKSNSNACHKSYEKDHTPERCFPSPTYDLMDITNELSKCRLNENTSDLKSTHKKKSVEGHKTPGIDSDKDLLMLSKENESFPSGYPVTSQKMDSRFVTPLRRETDRKWSAGIRSVSVASKKKQVLAILISSSDEENEPNVVVRSPKRQNEPLPRRFLTEPKCRIQNKTVIEVTSDSDDNFEKLLLSSRKKKIDIQKRLNYRDSTKILSDNERQSSSDDDDEYENFLKIQNSRKKPSVRSRLDFNKPLDNFIVNSSFEEDDDDQCSSKEESPSCKPVNIKYDAKSIIQQPLHVRLGILNERNNIDDIPSGKETTSRKIPLGETNRFTGSTVKNCRLSFVASLSENAKSEHCHLESFQYKDNFKKHKDVLVEKLYSLFNKDVFENKLPADFSITWNPRMTKTAGFCYMQKCLQAPNGRSSSIELSTKVLDCAERLRDTLLHELCHAACWLIQGVRDGHGPLWKLWALKAAKTYPEIPQASRCHHYDIKTKYTYQCVKCGHKIGRHSKSLNVSKERCRYCGFRYELLQDQRKQVPRSAGKFAMFVKENYKFVKLTNNVGHPEVMKLLSAEFHEKMKMNT